MVVFIPILHRLIRLRYFLQGIQSRSVTIGHRVLHYCERTPERYDSTIVFIHGLGTSSSSWINVLPRVNQRYRLLALDLPGFGLSPAPEGEALRIDDHSNVLAQFVDVQTSSPFILVGHSFGGWIATKYACLHREKVSRLILVNTAGIYHEGVDQLRELFDLKSVEDTTRLLERIWMRYPWYFRPFASSVYHDLICRKVPDIVRTIRKEDFINADLRTLDIPVGVIWALGDRLIPHAALEVLSQNLEAGTLHTIEDSGHVPQLEAPDAFLSALHEALGTKE